MHSDYQDVDFSCLVNPQSPVQHTSLQSEMMQCFPDLQTLQRVYQNSHSIQPNFVIPNGQNVDNDNSQKWHSLISNNQPAMFNQSEMLQFKKQAYVNLKTNVQPSSQGIYPSADNHYLPPQEQYDNLMQSNPETQQFFLHPSQQKIRKSWDISPSPYVQESQNIWNGR